MGNRKHYFELKTDNDGAEMMPEESAFTD